MSRLLAISATLGVAGATAASAVGHVNDVLGATIPGGSPGSVVTFNDSRYTSLRDFTLGTSSRANLGTLVNGDSFNAGFILRNPASFRFGDTGPDACAIGSECPNGTMSLDGTAFDEPVSLRGAVIPVSPLNDIYDIVVSQFSNSGTDMLPSAATIGGAPLQQIWMQVGTGFIGSDGVSSTFPRMVFDVLSADFVLFHNGQNPFFPAGTTTSGPMGTTAGDVTAVDATPTIFGEHRLLQNIAGFGINEFQLKWRVQISPTPGATALFALAGLAAVRRRRS